MVLNLQFIPAPAVCPTGAKIWQLNDPSGELGECESCGGTGRMPKGDEHRKCGGTGRVRAVRAMRMNVPSDRIDEVSAWLDQAWADCTVRAIRPRVQVTVELHETGGGFTNTGSSNVICGLNGEPLPSVYGIPKCNEAHAVYYVHGAMQVVYSHARGHGGGQVNLIGIDREARHNLGIYHRPLWRFADDVLRTRSFELASPVVPTDLVFPFDAVQAAMAKARTYHCRSAFYSAGEFASGSSGARVGAGAAFGGDPSPFKGPGAGYDINRVY